MTQAPSRGILQSATTIVKNTETLIGFEIPCAGYDTITFFLDYVNGDETNILLTPYFMYATGGTAYSIQSWTVAAGTRTKTDSVYSHGATGNLFITLTLDGFEYIKLLATADNTGTPTGTLAATYTLTNNGA